MARVFVQEVAEPEVEYTLEICLACAIFLLLVYVGVSKRKSH